MYSEKKIIVKRISKILNDREDIIFAYIFGSFVTSPTFSDIDVGIFVDLKEVKDSLELELELEDLLEKEIRYPMDVRIINRAPIYFSYEVIKNGHLIVDKKPSLRADFEGRIFKTYFDMLHFREEYLAEVKDAPI